MDLYAPVTSFSSHLLSSSYKYNITITLRNDRQCRLLKALGNLFANSDSNNNNDNSSNHTEDQFVEEEESNSNNNNLTNEDLSVLRYVLPSSAKVGKIYKRIYGYGYTYTYRYICKISLHSIYYISN